MRDICAALANNAYDTQLAASFGEMSKLQLLGFQINHNGHHLGQLAQTLKRGAA